MNGARRWAGHDDHWSVIVENEAATHQLARLLGGIVGRGAVLVLEGDLGAGKTTFVKGLAEGLGIDPGDVSSPTFTLIHEYEGDRPLYHFDAYRLEHPLEFAELGADDYLLGDGVTAVEWGDRVRDELPENRLEIVMTAATNGGASARRIEFRPLGEEAAAWVMDLRRTWEEERPGRASDRS